MCGRSLMHTISLYTSQFVCSEEFYQEHFFAEMSSILEKNDTILVKASHAMAFEKIVKKLERD